MPAKSARGLVDESGNFVTLGIDLYDKLDP
jgi:hypothetical protein